MAENPWSAVRNPTSAVGLSGSIFGPSSLVLIYKIDVALQLTKLY